MKILIIGQVSQATGLSRITRIIAEELSEIFEVHILGFDTDEKSKETIKTSRFILHHNTSPIDIFAEESLQSLVNDLKPEAILIYHDPWIIPRFTKSLFKSNHKAILVGYTPLDGNILQIDIIRQLTCLDALVVFNEFGYDAVRSAAQKAGVSQNKPFHNIAVIPHPLSEDKFYQLGGEALPSSLRRLAARKELFPDKPSIWKGFWVLNANRNQPRKRIDITLKGFAKFAEGKPDDVRLYLHMSTKNSFTEVEKMVRELGLKKRIIYTAEGKQHPEVPCEHLNLIYNACDVGVNTSMGEGWGLVSFEHAATGAPQVVPDHSACANIWKEAAELMPITRKTCGYTMLEGAEVSPEALSKSLERLYADKLHYEHLQRQGLLVTQNKAYHRDEVAIQWKDLFLKLTSGVYA